MQINKHHKPAFFRELTQFLQRLPSEPHSSVNDPLLDSYLEHYSLQLSESDDCARHEIWRNEIHSIYIVEQCWQPKKPNGKQIILSHGYFDHTALYGKIIRWALAEGYTIHSFDLPGHGLSNGEQASIDSFDDYSQILLAIAKREKYPSLLYIGQSTGCSIILNALLNSKFETLRTEANLNSPEQIILLAPLVRSIHWEYLRWVYFTMNLFLSSIKRTFLHSSHDQQFNDFIHHQDPLQSRRLPLKWLGAMEEWNKSIKNFKPRDDIHCFIIQGTSDSTVDYIYNLQTIKQCLPATNTRYIFDGYHHLANESEPYWKQVKQLLSTLKHQET